MVQPLPDDPTIVWVTIGVEDSYVDGMSLLVVRNTYHLCSGRGLSHEDLVKLFERFSQAQPRTDQVRTLLNRQLPVFDACGLSVLILVGRMQYFSLRRTRFILIIIFLDMAEQDWDCLCRKCSTCVEFTLDADSMFPSRSLIEAHGGFVEVKSEKGQVRSVTICKKSFHSMPLR